MMRFLPFLFIPLLFVSCIDEDLSACGRDYAVEYRVELTTNLKSEIGTQLTSADEQRLGKNLEQALAGIFTNRAHDIELNFYDAASHEAKHSVRDVINNNQASYTIYLPAQNYMHLALANLQKEPHTAIVGAGNAKAMTLQQNAEADTAYAHQTGLFTAREEMKVENTDQTFHVTLYMQNAAAALVINPKNAPRPTKVEVFSKGFANAFAVCDSLYAFDENPVVRTNDVADEKLICRYSVNFPSPESGNWEFHAYVTMPGDPAAKPGTRAAKPSITRTVLTVPSPLRAGELRIIKTALKDDGSLVPESNEVGASITLDWKPGGNHDVEL